MTRENSEERIKATLDRFTVKEDPKQMPQILNHTGKPHQVTNQDILPFTYDFGNKAVWEITEGVKNT